MAALALHVAMDAAQRERGALVVIEQGWLPLGAVMAIGTGRDRILGELLAVDVLVTVLTLLRRRLEIHMEQVGFQVRRLVAIDTGGGPVRSN